MTACRYNNSGQSNLEFEYLGEFETEFEAGVQAGSINEKKQRSKISCYCPCKWGKELKCCGILHYGVAFYLIFIS
jgi:hypothetical protein